MSNQPEKKPRGRRAQTVRIEAVPGPEPLDLDRLADHLMPLIEDMLAAGVLYVDKNGVVHARPTELHIQGQVCARCGQLAVFARGESYWCLAHALEEMLFDLIERGGWPSRKSRRS